MIQGLQAHKGRLVPLVPGVNVANKDLRVQRVPQVPAVHRARWDPLVLLAQKGKRAIKVSLDQLGQWDQEDLRAKRDLLGRWDPQGRQERPDRWDPRGRLEQRESRN